MAATHSSVIATAGPLAALKARAPYTLITVLCMYVRTVPGVFNESP